jgi:branched-chain amino acid aminotransferase
VTCLGPPPVRTISESGPAGRWVLHDGAIRPAGEVRLTASTQALNYGTGVFEGIRSYRDAAGGGANLFRLREHYARLAQGARLLRIDLGFGVDELSALTVKLLQRNGHQQDDAYIRPLAYKLALEPGASFGVKLRQVTSALTVVTLPMGRYVPAQGVRCRTSAWRRVPDAALPARFKITGGYANNAIAADDAHSAGFDDAILLDMHGYVAEASTANIFLVHRGELITPPAGADILPGITRASVIELARRELSAVVVERPVARSELLTADEVFLTGTGVEVVGVPDVDGEIIGEGGVGPVTRALARLYDAAVRGRLDGYRHWLTPVPGGSGPTRESLAGTGTVQGGPT